MNRGPTVGVLSPLVGGFYFGGVLSGINAAARARDGTVLAVQTFDAGVEHTDYHRPPRFTERIGWAHFDGVIVVVNAVDPDDLAMLVDSGKPIVMVSNDLDMGCSTVAPDNAGGISAAVDHLVAHGHSRIGFVGCLSRTDLRERYEAYLDAMKKHGLSTARSLHHEVDDSDEQGGRQAGRALLAAGIPSTALIAATDRNALGLMQCLSDAGLTLPRDQAIIGFDDTEAAEHAVPRLTSIRQDFREVGRTAADVLLDELQGVARSPSARRVPTTLVQRESCGCGRADAPLGAVTRITTRKNAQAQLRQALDLAVRRGAARSSSEPVALGQAVDLIVAELSAAVDDGPRVPGPDLNLAMRDLLRISPSVDVVDAVLSAVRAGGGSLRAKDADPAAALRFEVASNLIATAIRDAQLSERYRETTYFRDAFNTQYAVSMALLTERQGQEHDLGWLTHTAASAGALAVWTGDRRALDTVSLFDADAGATSGAGQIAPEAFPPEQLFRAAAGRSGHIVFAVPVRAGHNDWGWLGVVGPIEARPYFGREPINQWSALLAVALEVAAKRREVADLGRELARHSMEVDLRQASDRQQLSLAYQPIFTLRTGAVVGVEALLRWEHPTRGSVPPVDFIALAEQRGLIVPIGSWVLNEAFRQLDEWSGRDGFGGLQLAINVSGKQLVEPDLVTTVQRLLARHHIEPARITLEITETTMIDEGGSIGDTLAGLRALGVRLALDDFGTGYSSLVHLRDFPVNTLKIDRSFVEQLRTGSRAREIIGALTAMAHFLDMTVVGEGIERQNEWDELQGLDCDEGQGHLFARALAPEDLVRFLDERRLAAAACGEGKF